MNNFNEIILDLLAKFQAKHPNSTVSPIRLVKRAIYNYEHRRWSSGCPQRGQHLPAKPVPNLPLNRPVVG